jgi:hypothetical protein
MDTVCSTDLYSPAECLAFNRVRKFKGLHSVADVSLVDGITIDPFVFTREPSDSSHVFLVERPTKEDFATFRTVVLNLCYGNRRLPAPLGPYINKPHHRDVWFVNKDRSELYRVEDNSLFFCYARSNSHRVTHQGTPYKFSSVVAGQCDRSTRASVQVCPMDENLLILHSISPVYLPSPSRQSFMEQLHSLPNQSLWRTFTKDGDGSSWIFCSLLAGNLIMMSDGSYNENIALDLCSCAVVFRD